jgi:hypothetical protein
MDTSPAVYPALTARSMPPAGRDPVIQLVRLEAASSERRGDARTQLGAATGVHRQVIPAVGVPGRLEDGDHPGALQNHVLEHAPGAGQPGHEESAPRDR